ncbi:hypothetical protein [uncultured Cloacibacillus sp.]|uniref:hypothetical protein n=1 Tax=uncultured Cloacibacillus sp. TaxID=889794 RepID=UPI003209F5B0
MTVFAPFGTMLVVSLVLSIIFNIFSRAISEYEKTDLCGGDNIRPPLEHPRLSARNHGAAQTARDAGLNRRPGRRAHRRARNVHEAIQRHLQDIIFERRYEGGQSHI